MPNYHHANETIQDFLSLVDLYWPRLGAALLGGAFIGVENQIYGKAAGLRTCLLVALGCCVITVVSIETAYQYGGEPGRITAQLVTGIGFLGGGVIMQQKGHIRGITTAASILVVSGIGMVAGSGYIVSATAIGALGFAILLLLRPVDYTIDKNRIVRRLREMDRTESLAWRRAGLKLEPSESDKSASQDLP